MDILDKDNLPEHWAWWKRHITFEYNHWKYRIMPNDINGYGLWAKFSYIITVPFYLWFHCTCFIPNSFLQNFIFDHLDDNRPEGFWKTGASLSRRILVYIIATPQMLMWGLLALSFLMIGLSPIFLVIMISIGFAGVIF